MASRVILLVGCSGSGKSTYAQVHFPKAVVVSADHYFEELAASTNQTFEEVWNLWQLGSAHSQCQQRFLNAISKKVPVVIVDNTNVRRADRHRYIKMATELGCETELHVLSPWIQGKPAPSPKQIKAYVKLCHGRNAHGVPLDIVEQQFAHVDMPSGIYSPGKPPQYLRPMPKEMVPMKPIARRPAEFIVFAVKQAHEAEEFGVSRNESCRNLKTALHQHWQHKTMGQHGQAKKGDIPRSKAATGRPLSECVVEHSVPLMEIVNRLMGLDPLTERRVTNLLKKFFRVRLVTKDEDRELNKGPLRYKMPDGWDGKDVFARYRAAGIKLVNYE